MHQVIKYEAPLPPEELRSEMLVAASASVGYYIMLGLSASLATLGLIANSSVVIIGAMIIAPLMNPIIANAFALARGNREIFTRSVFSIATGVLLVIAVAMGVTLLVDSKLQGGEVLSRGNPSLIDLGVAVASGIAGAIAWSRRKIANALPGVAIAVALVPPLCAAGVGFALGDQAVKDPLYTDIDEIQAVEWGALLLFLTNFAAILLFGCLVFLVQGYGRWKGSMLRLVSVVVLVGVLLMPLSASSGKIHMRSRVMDILKTLSRDFPDWEKAQLSHAQVEFEEDVLVVGLRVAAPSGVIGGEDVAAIEDALAVRLGRPVRVQISLLEFQVVTRPTVR